MVIDEVLFGMANAPGSTMHARIFHSGTISFINDCVKPSSAAFAIQNSRFNVNDLYSALKAVKSYRILLRRSMRSLG